jgi:hypothetical protein
MSIHIPGIDNLYMEAKLNVELGEELLAQLQGYRIRIGKVTAQTDNSVVYNPDSVPARFIPDGYRLLTLMETGTNRRLKQYFAGEFTPPAGVLFSRGSAQGWVDAHGSSSYTDSTLITFIKEDELEAYLAGWITVHNPNNLAPGQLKAGCRFLEVHEVGIYQSARSLQWVYLRHGNRWEPAAVAADPRLTYCRMKVVEETFGRTKRGKKSKVRTGGLL